MNAVPVLRKAHCVIITRLTDYCCCLFSDKVHVYSDNLTKPAVHFVGDIVYEI
jgi:hypothetical protein